MKKPDITGGPWKWVIHDHSMASLVGKREERDHVLSFSPCSNCQKEGESPFNKCTGPSSEDAKAIKEVPDMIDKLMKAYLALDDIPLDDREVKHYNLKEELYETLKNVGVTEL